MARIKKTIRTGVTKDAAEEAFATFAKADAEKTKIMADIELKCAKIREQHQERLNQLQGSQEEAFDILQTYALENQEELFSKKKSVELVHGTIGFRTGTPKLKTKKGFTWASVLELVKEFLPSYIRKTEEVTKDRLLAEREIQVVKPGDPLGPGVTLQEMMSKCGLMVVQDETFYVEPKKEEA